MPHNYFCIGRTGLERNTSRRVSASAVMTAVVCAGLLCLPAFGFSEDATGGRSIKKIGMLSQSAFGSSEDATGGRSVKEIGMFSQSAATSMPPIAAMNLPTSTASGCAPGLAQAEGVLGCRVPDATFGVLDPSFRQGTPPVKGKVVSAQGTKAKISKTVASNYDSESPQEASNAKLQPGEVMAAPMVILPETTTTIKLSASDLNRIICPSEVKEALTSDEKGLMIKISGKDVFLK